MNSESDCDSQNNNWELYPVFPARRLVLAFHEISLERQKRYKQLPRMMDLELLKRFGYSLGAGLGIWFEDNG
jgi:hypothetical protein